jgi:hypothetical protein
MCVSDITPQHQPHAHVLVAAMKACKGVGVDDKKTDTLTISLKHLSSIGKTKKSYILLF